MSKKKKIVLSIMLVSFLVIGVLGLIASIKEFLNRFEVYSTIKKFETSEEYLSTIRKYFIFSIICVVAITCFLIQNVYCLLKLKVILASKPIFSFNFNYAEYKKVKKEKKIINKKKKIEKLKKEIEDGK